MRLVVILLVATLTVPVLRAQSPAFKCSRLTRADGLVDNMISCVLQDSRGFLWFGSHHGLNRYDGYQMKTFRRNPRDPGALSSVMVTCLHEDARGMLWVGTSGGGVNRFVQETERFEHYHRNADSTSSSATVLAISSDANGYLWVLYAGGNGVQRFNPRTGQWKHYISRPGDPFSLSSNAVCAMCRDTRGRLWFATVDAGVNMYDPAADRFINVHSEPSYGHAAIGSMRLIAPLQNGLLYTSHSLDDDRIYHLAEVGGRLVRTAVALPGMQINNDNGVSSLLQDRSGMIWVGTLRGGLYMLSPDMQTKAVVHRSYTDIHSLSSHRIFALYQDRFGDVWIGTDAGVHRVHSRAAVVSHYQHNPLDPATISDSEIRAIHRSADGTVWLGMGGSGLSRSTDAGFRSVYVCRGNGKLAENTINILYPATGEKLWAGTNLGLYLFDPQRDSFTPFGADISGKRIWAIAQEGDSTLWVGAQSGGVTQIDLRSGRYQYHLQGGSAPNSIAGISVLSMLDDGAVLWVGTTQGLYKLHKRTGRTELFCHRPGDTLSLTYNHVWALHRARDGRYWVGTSGGGLHLFEPATGRFTAVRAGLPSSVICGILEDDRGALWITTDNGLAVFSPATGKCRVFGGNDGVFHSVFHFKSCFRDAEGTMYAGGMDGLMRFHPDSMELEERRAQLVLTGFRVYDRHLAFDTVISMKKQVQLDYRSNFFTVEFAVLNFAGPEQHRYRYRLEGYDRQWQETDGRRPAAVYTDVPPGSYRLVVQTANAAGGWEPGGALLDIVVDPAWWQTLWFQGMVAFGIVLAGAGSILRTMHNVRRKSIMERRLVESQLQALRAQMNPHFIFNSLNSIYYYIMSHDSARAQRYLCVFSKLLRQILEYSRKTFIPVSKEIEVLQMYLELEAMRFSQRFHYEITVSPEIDVEQQLIPAMLLQPYVENAVRHGLLPKEQDCRLTIDFQRLDDRIVCSITDNGIGRRRAGQLKEHSQMDHVSHGLALSKERMHNLSELHGRLYGVEVHDLTSDTGESLGTRIVLTFPAGIVSAEEETPATALHAG